MEKINNGASIQFMTDVSTKIQIIRESNSNENIIPAPTRKCGRRPSNPKLPTEVELKDVFGFNYDTCNVYVAFTEYGAGLGVFAKNEIPKNSVITEYCGNIALYSRTLPERHCTHIKSLKREINGIRGFQRPIPWMGVGSLLNSNINANCTLECLDENQCYVVSTRPIKKDEELLLNYRL